MEYLSGDDFLGGLPALLAGPCLRRTEPRAVTVWVALKFPCVVKLRILETEQQGQQLGQPVLSGQQHTVAVGRHLHVAAVTAKQGQPLACDRIYAYDLEFAAERPYSLLEALRNERVPTATVSYFAHELPTFTLPPQCLGDLKIAHGSCRKPHGPGFDTLPLLDCLIEANAASPKERPHQLFLTGDQVYGDDVADPLQWIATALGDTLLGWEEALPVSGEMMTPKQLTAGKRESIATHAAGFTAGLDGKGERVTSHFLSLGEYFALYVLARSPVCWPVQIPAGQEMIKEHRAIRRWNRDRHHIQQFIHTLWKVRRALANVPTYTIFDDHDVSDDWNLNQAWCLRVLGRTLGRRAVQNALTAYALCQGWGNTPWQFEPGQTGHRLLKTLERWSASQGQDSLAADAIALYLGLPPINQSTELPEFTQEEDVWILQRSPGALTWHYTVAGPCHEVLVLDTRTWRGYPVHAKPTAPPTLLSPSAFKEQIDKWLEADDEPYDDPAKLASGQKPSDAQPKATLVIASTNVISMKVLDWIQTWQLRNGKVFSADVGDSWNLNYRALATLITKLCEHRQAVVILSGDIHYSSAVHLSYRNHGSGHRANLLQLTSSAMKNQELLTQLLHTRLKQWLLPEPTRKWVGWLSPPRMEETPTAGRPTLEPQWSCQTRWLKRQRAQLAGFKPDLFWLTPPKEKNPYGRWLDYLKPWKSRWFQEGEEVVGVNNIALVHFQTVPPQQSPQTIALTQSHYWFSSWLSNQVVCSQFQTQLPLSVFESDRSTQA